VNEPPERPVLQWTRPMLTRFEKEHRKARDTRLDKFTFDGHDFDTSYAQYLIEFLKTEFQRRGI
jgi:hypothetical protein